VKRAAAALVLFFALRAALAFAASDPTFARGRGGAVAAEEGTAANVGIEILRKGGNATDAAVAVAFALAVTWPEAGNIGGGGFWISRDANGRASVIDFRERAPRAARRDMFAKPAKPGAAIPSSTDGPLASGVPGTVDGLALAHRRAGHLPWKAVVEPAVRLARDGFPMTENVRASIAADRKKLAADREAADVFLPGGEPPPVGALFRQPALARTLEAVRDRGEDGFYRGRVAREIEEGQKKAGGSINRGDLALYNSKVRKPVVFRFRDAEVLTTGAPSSGPAMAAMAALVESLGPKRFRAEDASGAHLLAEIEKRVYRDRNRYLGDPDFPGVRQDLFLSADRLRRIAATIDPSKATPADALRALGARDGSTTHFSVADARGNLVSVTTTLNDSFGNGRVAPGLGFLWNNEMDDFATRPGEPNAYGLIQGDVNSVAPGKRMLSAMCPMIAVIPKRGAFAWGSPGGSTILTTNFQVLLGLVLRGESLETAVGAPRFHQQDSPDVIEFERDRFDPAWVAALEGMGHTVKVSARDPVPGRIGRVHAVGVLSDGTVEAVADPRRQGAAMVVAPSP
jgi:gamma-glutamyltranspeptidase/glutathione hydrolase